MRADSSLKPLRQSAEHHLALSEERPIPPYDLEPALVGTPLEVIEANRNVVHRFGDYVLVQQVGWGGHGVVYRAWQKSARRFVALKFLHVGDEVAMQRFEREAQVVAKLVHPNIVPLYDVGHFEGRAFMTMKLIDGHTLDGARLDTKGAFAVIAAAADAVAYAHEQGIIHRDLKPANIMMTTEGHTYVMDFGLAQGLEGESKLTRTGVVNGTPSYMSPEHARGLTCDARSDVYSLGASLYELLGRRAPFEGATAVVVLAAVITDEPLSVRRLNPNITREMEAVVAKAMDKEPARRYQSADDFAADLRRLLRGEPVLARPLSGLPRALRWVKRHRLLAAFTALAVMGTVAAVSGSLFHAAATSRAHARAEHERRVAEEKLAQSLISAADVLVAKGRLADATALFQEAEDVLLRLGQSPLATRLGLMVARQAGSVPLIAFAAHSAAVTAVRFFPDGRRAATTSEDGTAAVWDTTTGRKLSVFSGHKGQVWGLAISSDGTQLATGSHDGSVKLWDVASASVLATYAAHQAPVGAVVFSPNGKRLYTGGEDNLIRVWNLEREEPPLILQGHRGRVRGLALSKNGEILVSASGDQTLRVWDVSKARTRTVIEDLAPLFAVRFIDNDSKLIVAGQKGELTTWTLDGKLVKWLAANRSVVSDLAIDPRGDLLVSAGWDARTRLFNLPNQELFGEIETSDARVLTVDVSADGNLLINGDSEGHLRVFDLRFAVGKANRRGLPMPVSGEFSRDGRLAASWQGNPHAVVLLDTETQQALRMLPIEGRIQRVAFAPTSTTLAVALAHGEVVLWNFDTQVVRRFAVEPKIYGLAYADNDTKLWIGAANNLAVYDVQTGQGQILLQDYCALRVSSSRDGRLVATVGADGRLGLWNAHSNELICWHSLGESAISVAFSFDSSKVAVGSALAGVKLIDIASNVSRSLTKSLAMQVFGVAFSPDGELLLSGGSDRTARLWDLKSGKELRVLPERSSTISNVAFSDDGKAFVSEQDGTFAVWDPKIAPAFDAIAKRVDEARTRIRQNIAGADDWRTLGDWFASRHVCSSAVEAYTEARSRGWSAASATYARCLWSVGKHDAAKVELIAAAHAGLLPDRYVRLLAAGPPLAHSIGVPSTL